MMVGTMVYTVSSLSTSHFSAVLFYSRIHRANHKLAVKIQVENILLFYPCHESPYPCHESPSDNKDLKSVNPKGNQS